MYDSLSYTTFYFAKEFVDMNTDWFLTVHYLYVTEQKWMVQPMEENMSRFVLAQSIWTLKSKFWGCIRF